MKILFILACILVTANCFDKQEWENYKKSHGKVYKNGIEDEFRLKIYLDRKSKIDQHNELYKRKLATYKMAVNQFTDMTEQEVTQTMTGYQPIQKHSKNAKAYLPEDLAKNPKAPSTLNWCDSGYCTPVKNQGSCGACWSFAVTGGLEGQHFAVTGNLVSLSEQQLVDCSRDYGLAGCEGGNNELGFEYVMYSGGLDTEDSYPYEAVDGSCRFNPNTVGTVCSGYGYVQNSNEDALFNAVSTIGPISVGIDAESSFQSYSGGVYYEPNCNPDARNHAVLVVGYGNQDGQDYWLVKNSWGTGWGEAGFVKMSRNRDNNCGIGSDPSWPVVPS